MIDFGPAAANTLSGHASVGAARTVRTFLASLPASYPPRLPMTTESSADQLLRASHIVDRPDPQRH